MPYRWTICHEEELANVIAEGLIDISSSVEALFEVTSDPEFSSHYRVLVDMRKMNFSPRLGDALEIASVLRKARSLLQGRLAVVTTSGPSRLAVMVASIAAGSGITIRSFEDYDAAHRWVRE